MNYDVKDDSLVITQSLVDTIKNLKADNKFLEKLIITILVSGDINQDYLDWHLTNEEWQRLNHIWHKEM